MSVQTHRGGDTDTNSYNTVVRKLPKKLGDRVKESAFTNTERSSPFLLGPLAELLILLRYHKLYITYLLYCGTPRSGGRVVI